MSTVTATRTQLRATLRAAEEHASDCPFCGHPGTGPAWAGCPIGEALAASLRTLAGGARC